MAGSNSSAGSLTLTRPCVKCRSQEATLDSRSQPVCRDCFTKFISAKCIKQIGILGKETRPPPSATNGPPTGTRRYLLGLSLGVSSTVLLHLLNENVEFQLARGRSAPFELTVVHIDDDTSLDHVGHRRRHPSPRSTSSETVLARYRARYPRFSFHAVPLSSAIPNHNHHHHHPPESPTGPEHPADANDGGEGNRGGECGANAEEAPSPSPPPPPAAATSAAAAAAAAAGSTTAASRSDVTRLLTRRALLAQARARGCQALLLGHSTTALAELTLAEAAKGRGFAVPWLVGDGPAAAAGPGTGSENENGSGSGSGEVLLVCHPLRDALRKELVIYAGLVDPPLTDLLSGGGSSSSSAEGSSENGGPSAAAAASSSSSSSPSGAASAVVSHRDLSIEEVMRRYFAEVEESYPSVVANVARTTGKLVRAGEDAVGGRWCGLCGMPLDEDGDERWRGELGIQERTGAVPELSGERLCYGCQRSTGG
ncbi:uncharacterized protein P884DRAFT_235307 [Thermothelomyces heterothallicus CBS 202.75]|uniref:uncharacterized protein n=1 Tax=Thermothelomyces heterothallicus CBS 202.75 TaxID=1149848 RepID=UPI003742FEA2